MKLPGEDDRKSARVLPDGDRLGVAQQAGPDAMAVGESHAQEGVASPEDQRLTPDRREEAVQSLPVTVKVWW